MEVVVFCLYLVCYLRHSHYHQSRESFVYDNGFHWVRVIFFCSPHDLLYNKLYTLIQKLNISFSHWIHAFYCNIYMNLISCIELHLDFACLFFYDLMTLIRSSFCSIMVVCILNDCFKCPCIIYCLSQFKCILANK